MILSWFVKIRQNVIQKQRYLLYLIHHSKRLDAYTNIYSANPLYFIICGASGYFKEKNT